MATLEQRIAALERKAKRAAQRDDRPWEVIFAEYCAELKREADAILRPYGGDAAAFFDHAEKANCAAMRKRAR